MWTVYEGYCITFLVVNVKDKVIHSSYLKYHEACVVCTDLNEFDKVAKVS